MFKKNNKTLKDEILLSFKNKSKNKELEISFKDGTTSVIAFGSTGSGKTTTVMFPALERLIENDCPGIILDVKGDYLDYCFQKVDRDRLMIIGGSKASTPCNILQGLSEEMFRSFISDISPNKKDPYWGTGGIRDSMLIYHFYLNCFNRTVTLSELYYALNNPQAFCKMFDQWITSTQEINESIKSVIDSCVSESFSILEVGKSIIIHSDQDTSIIAEDSKTLQQYTWHTQNLKNKLRPFYDNPLLREKLSAIDVQPLSLSEMIYEKNMVIIPDLPQSIFGTTGYFICKLLRERFTAAIFSTSPSYRETKGIGKEKFTFMLIDEYQNYLNINNESNASGLIDDNTWTDKSRSYGHINIVSTQGVSSLLAQTNSIYGVLSLLQNIRCKIYLPTDDEETIKSVDNLTRHVSINSSYLLFPEAIGDCLIYSSLMGNSGLFECEMAKSKYGHMNDFIDFKFDTVDTDYSFNDLALVKNEYYTAKDIEYNEIPKIIVIKYKHSLAKDDFINAIRKEIQEFNRFDEVFDKIFFVDLPKNATSLDIGKIYAENIKKSPGSIVCIMRGGGNREDFDVFNNKTLNNLIKYSIENKLISLFYSAIGHYSNKTELDKLSYEYVSTPTDLGYVIGRKFK
ncbi:DUF87 domain-containing protein [Vibrio parahaemolyticus]|nr:DUF87 domain-containing protein [Vibrio parahaemolyticus]